MLEFDFASKRPITYAVPTIDDVLEIPRRLNCEGKPWKTKSEAELSVLTYLPFKWMQRFAKYEPEEVKNIPSYFDIRGFRAYLVEKIPSERIGGTEFHRIRQELIYALEGEVEWTFEDVFGKKKELLLNNKNMVYFPPFIRHDYKTQKGGGGSLLVICNTLFDPNDKRTWDTYSAEIFEELKKNFKRE